MYFVYVCYWLSNNSHWKKYTGNKQSNKKKNSNQPHIIYEESFCFWRPSNGFFFHYSNLCFLFILFSFLFFQTMLRILITATHFFKCFHFHRCICIKQDFSFSWFFFKWTLFASHRSEKITEESTFPSWLVKKGFTWLTDKYAHDYIFQSRAKISY